VLATKALIARTASGSQGGDAARTHRWDVVDDDRSHPHKMGWDGPTKSRQSPTRSRFNQGNESCRGHNIVSIV